MSALSTFAARIVKAAVSPVSSLFGSNTNQMTRPVSGGTGWWGWARESFPGAWQRGVQVDPLGGLASFGAVYACITRIANDIAKLQPLLMKQRDDGTWELAPMSSPFWAPLLKPNSFQNRIQFYAYWLTSKLMHGQAYQFKVRDGRNMVQGMRPLDPRRVTPLVTSQGDVFYSLGGDDLARIPAGQVIPASEIIHDRMNTLWHPLCGVSPIFASGLAATQGNRIQMNSASFFENMSRPSGMLTAPGTIDDPTADRIKRYWEENFTGGNVGRLAVLGDGLSYQPMTINAVDAELIKQLNWAVEDVARTFGMPLYKINAGPIPTNNNVEALEQQYYSGCLQVLIEAAELCLKEGLALPDGYKVEFDLDGLLRMDSSTQFEALGKAVGAGIMSPNEARAKVNLPPVNGGETPYLQEQNFALSALAKRDAMENPWASSKPAPAPAPAAPPAPAQADEEAAKAFVAELLKQLDEVEA